MRGDVQTAAPLVRTLHDFEATPQIPRLNIHFMATAPGNEHLLALMTEPVADPGPSWFAVHGTKFGIWYLSVTSKTILTVGMAPTSGRRRRPRLADETWLGAVTGETMPYKTNTDRRHRSFDRFAFSHVVANR
jgi:hypothetical protein